MKNDSKKFLFALLTVLLVVALSVAFVGCGDNPPDESTPAQTLPPFHTTASSTAPEATETTTAAGTNPIQTTASTTPVETTSAQKPEETTDVPSGDYINPLTGEPSVKDLSAVRPVAVVVDNINKAYAHQTGLDDADILYEALVAPGITRFLAVYADYTSVDSVCNIRSGRDYHMDMAAFSNAILVCHGGSVTQNYDFFELAVSRYGDRYGFVDTCHGEGMFNQAETGELFGTRVANDSRGDLGKVEVLFKPEAFTKLLASSYSKFVKAGGTITGAPKKSFKFVTYGTTKSMAGASTAKRVMLQFDSTKTVGFEYDATKDQYLRTQDGFTHVDANTGKQLSFTNVLALFTTVTTAETGIKNDTHMTLVATEGTGDGYYFYGGKVINVTWSSDGNTLTILDPNGQELKLATGNTYVGFLDKTKLDGEFWY